MNFVQRQFKGIVLEILLADCLLHTLDLVLSHVESLILIL